MCGLVMGARSSIVTAGPAGAGMGASVPVSARGGGRRGVIRGWSRQSAGRHLRWLHSVDYESMGECHGVAITVTIRDTPETEAKWLSARSEFLRFLRGIPGFWGLHWVTEWTKRGVPHLHIGLWTVGRLDARQRFEIRREWVRIAEAMGTTMLAQHVGDIPKGRRAWDRYCGKHSARSVQHYQRQGLPDGWRRTGRLWGKDGLWETREDRYLLNGPASIQMRRLVKAYCVSTAARDAALLSRRTGKRIRWNGVQAAKRMLRTDPMTWALKGWRCWIPEPVLVRMLEAVNAMTECFVGRIVESDEGIYSQWQLAEDRAAAAIGVEPRQLPRIAIEPL